MRFPWQRKPPKVETDKAAADQALRETENRWPEVHKVAQKAVRLHYRNGFGEAITRSMGGR